VTIILAANQMGHDGAVTINTWVSLTVGRKTRLWYVLSGRKAS